MRIRFLFAMDKKVIYKFNYVVSKEEELSGIDGLRFSSKFIEKFIFNLEFQKIIKELVLLDENQSLDNFLNNIIDKALYICGCYECNRDYSLIWWCNNLYYKIPTTQEEKIQLALGTLPKSVFEIKCKVYGAKNF